MLFNKLCTSKTVMTIQFRKNILTKSMVTGNKFILNFCSKEV